MTWTIGQILYRAEWHEHYQLRGPDSPPDFEPGPRYIRYREYRVLRLTPCGAWLLDTAYDDTWWSDQWREDREFWRSFATNFVWSSKGGALRSLEIRVVRNIEHCRRRLAMAERRAKILKVDFPAHRLYPEDLLGERF